MHDLLVRGARVVDALGRAALAADIAVIDGRLVEFGRPNDRGGQELVADGRGTQLAILRHPSTVTTLTDAGAHVGQIVDGGLQVYFLAHWVRTLHEFRLEEAIRMVTHEPARAWGFADRGSIRPEYAADLNILDPEVIGPRPPEIVDDLLGGHLRLEQKPGGRYNTVVNGVVTVSDGVATGRGAGRLLRRRSARAGRSA
jgi:N-acyl-D-aspartate/D-glutamate deacylase